MGSDKTTTTIRLSEHVSTLLKRAGTILGRSQSQVVEDALNEYFKNHNLYERYIVSVDGDFAVLIRVEGDVIHVLEHKLLNGTAPSEIARLYAEQLRSPVTLVMEGHPS